MALVEHARSSIMYERQLLRELEALRADISGAAKKVVPLNGPPKPTIIPPLEDFEKPQPLPAPPSAPASNGFHPSLPSQLQPPPQTAGPSGFKPSQPMPSQHSPLHSTFPQTPTSRQQPLSVASNQPIGPGGPLSPTIPSTSTTLIEGTSAPATPSTPKQKQVSLSPQSPKAGPSASAPHSPSPKLAREVPPLGGRFVDGTKSMFIQKPTGSPSPLASSASVSNLRHPASSNPPFDPLRNTSYSTVSSPLHDPLSSVQPPLRPQSVDPLGGLQPHQMTSSLRVQPTRPRLDAREAASKLANMF